MKTNWRQCGMSYPNNNSRNDICEEKFEQKSSAEKFEDYGRKKRWNNSLEIEHDENKMCEISAESLINDVSAEIDTNYQSEEDENSEDSFSETVVKIQNFSSGCKHARLKSRKKTQKRQPCRLTVSLRYGKPNQLNKFKKNVQRKKFVKPGAKIPVFAEQSKEIPLKGKRGRLGGKAKAKPPQEECHDKKESDEESDSLYCYRVSLGYFQKFKDDSGASTSHQCEEDNFRNKAHLLKPSMKIHINKSEEMELLELQRWGTSSVSAYNLHEKMEKFEIKEDSKSEL